MNDGREDVPEIEKPDIDGISDPTKATTRELSELQLLRMGFWKNFVQYCCDNGRGDIATQAIV
ncbi:hypothetical protein [Oceanobacillus rekensis]|uniref:hypothetical protein n=1 Tax=Oceanobacillus rekensis TaxID=937927 RepID=UPI001594CCCB|nr:hypothetical protein [Oceanobacillus rekensis]